MKTATEIGGYLQMEELPRCEYHPELFALNLARCAFLFAADLRGCKKVYLPYFLCDSVIDAARHHGMDIEFYHIDEDFRPVLPQTIDADALFYVVNSYGHLSDDDLILIRDRVGYLLVDHVHDFFRKPLPGMDALYSCRKFFGLPDGAYLSIGEGLPHSEEAVSRYAALFEDRSSARMGHILGRYEDGASAHYQTMLANADTFHQEPPKRMSPLTHNLLRGIDYETAKAKRNENYDKLDQMLGSASRKAFPRTDGPLCYPFYTKENGAALRKVLAAEKIFVPTYWSNVVRDLPEDSIEHDFAANILALPCDQRYTPDDMAFVADTLLKLLEK